jgi:hypothetical protein
MLGVNFEIRFNPSILPPINHAALEKIVNLNDTLRALLINRVYVNIIIKQGSLRERKRMIQFIEYVYDNDHYDTAHPPTNTIKHLFLSKLTGSFNRGFKDNQKLGHVLTKNTTRRPDRWALIYDNVSVAGDKAKFKYYQRIYNVIIILVKKNLEVNTA